MGISWKFLEMLMKIPLNFHEVPWDTQETFMKFNKNPMTCRETFMKFSGKFDDFIIWAPRPHPFRALPGDSMRSGGLASPRQSLLLTGCCPWTPFGAYAAPHAPRQPRRCAGYTSRDSLSLPVTPWDFLVEAL